MRRRSGTVRRALGTLALGRHRDGGLRGSRRWGSRDAGVRGPWWWSRSGCVSGMGWVGRVCPVGKIVRLGGGGGGEKDRKRGERPRFVGVGMYFRTTRPLLIKEVLVRMSVAEKEKKKLAIV